MRQKTRVDANQKEIVAAFRKRGATVQHLHQIPGALDLLIGYAGIDVRVEIKDGSKPPSTQRLTEAEAEVFGTWKGRPPRIICDIGGVNQLIDEMQTV